MMVPVATYTLAFAGFGINDGDNKALFWKLAILNLVSGGKRNCFLGDPLQCCKLKGDRVIELPISI